MQQSYIKDPHKITLNSLKDDKDKNKKFNNPGFRRERRR